MNWDRARKFSASEEKYDDGTLLPNGRQVRHGHHGKLDCRARTAEAKWLFETGLGVNLGKMTARQIDSKKTKNGGWTRAQLAEWGVPWPPPRGWRQALIEGKPIPGQVR
jgi:hypothetical protein